jgi:predicted dinucleotide-binding enzyme
MIIGIVGSDNRAVEIGRMLSRCGHTLTFSDPLEAGHAEKAVAALPEARVESPYQQAATSDALVMAIRWQDLDSTLTALGPFSNKLVIDATHAPPIEDGSGAECIAIKMDNRHVVKAFVEPVKPGAEISVCSDDPEAMRLVEDIISSCGCRPVEKGTLSNAAAIERAALTNGKVLPE